MTTLNRLAEELGQHLQTHILPFWIDRMQDGQGGFIGRISGNGIPDPDAPRGAILYSRILWSFSAAYRQFHRPEYLNLATQAKEWLLKYFYDTEYGGVYWMVDRLGQPIDTHKQFYALGFAIYGLSEYARATGDREALEYAIRLYHSIEQHALDPIHGGYLEATERDWHPRTDMRLSLKDDNAPKSMNTHLHILEPYTNLYRVWPDADLRKALMRVIELFLRRIENPDTHHLGLFFENDWRIENPGTVSFGHDIEASWLLLEAAMTVNEPSLTEQAKRHARMIAEAALEGYLPDGSLAYERDAHGTLNRERHWWVQAECVVGLTWLAVFHNLPEAIEKAEKSWEYIKTHLVDREQGEWFWSIREDGSINRDDDKAGFWKCPYHNSRMCLEVMNCARIKG